MKAFEIKITTPQNPLRCHNMLTDVKKGKKELTSKFALEFLQSTNNRKNIADFLDILETHLTNHPETVKEYSRILFGLTTNRNQPEDITQKAKMLRQTYNITSAEVEIPNKSWEDKGTDYRCVSKLIFPKDLIKLDMEACDLSQTELTLSQATFVTLVQFDRCKMPPKIDFSTSCIWAIYYKRMDMASFEPSYPETLHYLDVDETTKFPSVLDLSKIKKINVLTFYDCDMSNIQEIRFPQSMGTLHLYKAVLPACLDIEELKKNCRVIINECMLPKQKEKHPENIEQLTPKNRLLQRIVNKIIKGRNK